MKQKALIFFLFFLSRITIAQNYYDEGLKLYYKGDMGGAIGFFTKAINSKQNIERSLMMRGAANTMISNFFAASQDLKSSIQMDSNYYKSYFYYGRVFFFQGFYTSAIKYYNIAISKNPKDADVYDDRAMAKIKLDDFAGAIIDENIAISIDSTVPDYFVNRAFAKSQTGKYKEAIIDLNISLKLGDIPKAYSIRAFCNTSLGNHKQAIADYDKAISLMPDAKDLYYYRALSYKALGKKQSACADLQKSAGLDYELAKAELKSYCEK